MSDLKNVDGTGVIGIDSWLEPYRGKLAWRHSYFLQRLGEIASESGSLDEFAKGYEYFGFNRGEKDGKNGVWYREWAPEALGLFLTGDFNSWSRFDHPLKRDQYGVWSIFLPDDDFKRSLVHGSRVKVHVASKKHNLDRIPSYIRRVERDEGTGDFFGVFWMPKDVYRWKFDSPATPKGLRIYEAHVGMAQEKLGVGSFAEFSDYVLPRIAKQGYNALQLMAIAQHPYYGSFGYQVSSFFATSHYFGDPQDLKKLIDKAHDLGLIVLMDLVHSHTVKNVYDGLNQFDGSDFQYFHAGARGNHEHWDTKLFDYGKREVIRFLLSNVRFWMDEYRFDGFRMDGVTSMIYKNHGYQDFDHYDKYFNENVDEDVLVYLKLVNKLVHDFKPEGVTIAEEVSGLPGLARGLEDGGVGFDYRLAMGLPDNWIKLVKEKSDESWNMGELFDLHLHRRFGERHIAYCESHDQGLVGDKTLAFWLMDKEMYDHMGVGQESVLIDRGIALHKLIRLLTFSLGGEGWLNFMGNEFGHPEWIDFPREGNGFSFHHARRQWSLVDNKDLKYKYMNQFDRILNKLDRTWDLLSDSFIELIGKHEERKLVVYRRGPLVFVFNFHPNNSYSDLSIGVPDKKNYQVVLSSDLKRFGGQGRVKHRQKYPVREDRTQGREQSVMLYLPSRTAQVLAPIG